jgi:hypothetical protein
MKDNLAAAAVAVTIILTFACARPPQPRNPATVRDSSGVTIVENHLPPDSLREVWQVDTAAITRIGDDDSDPHQHFTSVNAATRLSDGRVAIALDGQVNFFDRDGNYVSSSAPRGDGPGEFTGITAIYRAAGDALLVTGAARDRKTVVLSPKGAFVREVTSDCEKLKLIPAGCNVELLPDGSALIAGADSTIPHSATHRPTIRYPNNVTSLGPGHTRYLRRLYLIPPSLDTMYPTGIAGGIEFTDVLSPGGITTMVVHLFYSRRSYHVAGGSPLRLATARNPEYVINIWDLKGRLERSIRYAAGITAPTDEEKADNLKSLERLLEQQETGLSMSRAIEAAPIPDSVPAVFGLFFGPDNELLVLRQGLFASHTAHLFDVFDRDGFLLGRLRLPAMSKLLEVGDDYVLVQQTQADDVPHVVVFPLRR